jgi:outer membrane protein assembly factor BamB
MGVLGPRPRHLFHGFLFHAFPSRGHDRLTVGRPPPTMIPSRFSLAAVVSLSIAGNLHAAPSDWPQWRGPERNGVLPSSPPLAATWGANGPAKVWQSEPIPSDDEGGHGSVVTANGRVYLSVVWHRDEPSETRTITDLILRTRLNHQNPAGLGNALIEKIEATRESLPPTLRGAKLDAFAEEFIEANLDRKKKELYGGFVRTRFKKGKLAIPLTDYDTLRTRLEKPFTSQAEFEAWVRSQGFAEHVQQAVLEAVPASRRVAEDTVVCLDEKTGKTLWITKSPGEPKGRNCSSTPCVSNGLVFAMGSTHLYAVDADSGRLVWSQPLPSKAPGSSPLVIAGKVVIQAGKLLAYDAATGKPAWEQPQITGNNASPTAWAHDGHPLVIASGRSEIACVDAASGQIRWSTPGGGDSTPALAGDYMAALSSKETLGFAGYHLTATGAELLWNHPTDARRSQSSPVLFDGHAYLFEDGEHRCVALKTGEVAWTQKIPSSITSPVLADGKLFVVINNGNTLVMLAASPAERTELAKATIRALWVPSPTVAGGKVFVRAREGVHAYDLTESQ